MRVPWIRRDIPPSSNLSTICLSTSRDCSRDVIRLWYLPSWAVAGEPMASAGPVAGTAAATAGLVGVWVWMGTWEGVEEM